jgi:hypothetical protein
LRLPVEAWVVAYVKKGIERLEDRHAVEVAGLIDQLGPDHGIHDRDQRCQAHRRAAARAERIELARDVIRWCPSPERLGRWLVRAVTEFHVENLGAYLREACSKGDSGTLLESHAKNQLGQAAETWQDFTSATEGMLKGNRSAEVEELVAGGAAVLGADDVGRVRLREELRQYLHEARLAAARTVLVQLVGDDRSDIGIARAIGDACSLAQAKELLAA